MFKNPTKLLAPCGKTATCLQPPIEETSLTYRPAKRQHPWPAVIRNHPRVSIANGCWFIHMYSNIHYYPSQVSNPKFPWIINSKINHISEISSVFVLIEGGVRKDEKMLESSSNEDNMSWNNGKMKNIRKNTEHGQMWKKTCLKHEAESTWSVIWYNKRLKPFQNMVSPCYFHLHMSQMQELQFVSSSCHSFSSSREPPGDWSLPKRFRRHTQLDTWRKYVFLLNNGSEIERVQITI